MFWRLVLFLVSLCNLLVAYGVELVLSSANLTMLRRGLAYIVHGFDLDIKDVDIRNGQCRSIGKEVQGIQLLALTDVAGVDGCCWC